VSAFREPFAVERRQQNERRVSGTPNRLRRAFGTSRLRWAFYAKRARLPHDV